MGEALQQQAEHLADGPHGGLGERRVPQGQQQSGDQLELTQQFGVLHRLAAEPDTQTARSEIMKWLTGLGFT